MLYINSRTFVMINRRAFIKKCVASFYGSLLLLPACKFEIKDKQYYSFTVDEAKCLEAICEQFIPADDYPGAKEAGVVNFIDKLLYQRFPDMKTNYLDGISSLENYCIVQFDKPFEELSWDDQYHILEHMEKGLLSKEYWDKISQQQFFNMVLRNTMQGFYGPPRHGGNKDYVSYRMMRLDYPLLIGQNRYE